MKKTSYLNFEVGGFLIFLMSSQYKFWSMLGKYNLAVHGLRQIVWHIKDLRPWFHLTKISK